MANAHGRAAFARGAAALVLGLGVLLAAGCKDRQNRAKQGDDTAGAKEPAKGDEPLAAEDLDEEFEQDKAAATAKYKNKVIEVTGKVHKIDRSDASAPTVELWAGSDDDTVDCEFTAKDEPQLARLKPGQEVVIRGRCRGVDKETKSVTLERCSVVK